MPNEVQNFLAGATRKASGDLIGVIDGLPEDKRNWSPLDKGRTAVNQAAECVVTNRLTVTIIQEHAWPTSFSTADAFPRNIAALGEDWATIKAELQKETELAAAAIAAIPDADLSAPISTPFGEMTLGQVIIYSYWNMSYHQGQTTYISTLL